MSFEKELAKRIFGFKVPGIIAKITTFLYVSLCIIPPPFVAFSLVLQGKNIDDYMEERFGYRTHICDGDDDIGEDY